MKGSPVIALLIVVACLVGLLNVMHLSRRESFESPLQYLHLMAPVPPSVPSDATYAEHLKAPVEPKNYSKIHVIFSTECNAYQDWQSEVFMFAHRKLNFPGKVTRVVACDDPKWKEQLPLSTYDRYNVIHTPKFNLNKTIGDSYPVRNRPQGFKYLLDRGELIKDGEIVFVMDPDQILLALPSPEVLDMVSPGKAVAAGYGQGTRYLQWASRYCKGCGVELLTSEQRENLAIGAPYIMLAEDFRKIMPVWADTLEAIRVDEKEDKKAGWIGDMFAYSIASLKVKISHKRTPLMVSDVGDGREPWQTIHGSISPPVFVLHFCQKIKLPGYEWGKHDHHGFVFNDCKTKPLFEEAKGEALKYIVENSNKPLGMQRGMMSQIRSRRYAWIYEHSIPLANEAFRYYHNLFCENIQ